MAKQSSRAGKAESDIYTVLTFIATLVLLAAVIFVAWRANELYGFDNLFEFSLQTLTAPERSALA